MMKKSKTKRITLHTRLYLCLFGRKGLVCALPFVLCSPLLASCTPRESSQSLNLAQPNEQEPAETRVTVLLGEDGPIRLNQPKVGKDGVIFSLDLVLGDVEKQRDVTLQCYYRVPISGAADRNIELHTRVPKFEGSLRHEGKAFLNKAKEINTNWVDRSNFHENIFKSSLKDGAEGLAAAGLTTTYIAKVHLFPALPLGLSTLGALIGAAASTQTKGKVTNKGHEAMNLSKGWEKLLKHPWILKLSEFLLLTGAGGVAGGATGLVVSAAIPTALIGHTAKKWSQALGGQVMLVADGFGGHIDWVPSLTLKEKMIKKMSKIIRRTGFTNPFVFAEIENKHQIKQEKTLPCPAPEVLSSLIADPWTKLDTVHLLRNAPR